ncbi:MAG: FISUMP domain-containing protein, partial [Actinomycetota bacterium]|nr:FISUMP domain-containing protein [Actinomycetota bacterium]
ENLKTTKYRNGTSITYPGSNNTAWENNITGAYAWYDNDISWKNLYGALYNWYAVNNVNGLCPTDWHIPNDAEWTMLTNYAGGESVAGGKLKSTRIAPIAHPRWDSPNSGATDQYGFSAFPGGYRSYVGSFYNMGSTGYWWSASESSATYAWIRRISYDHAYFYRYGSGKTYGFSVRCVRDEGGSIILLGDANCDGNINVLDIITMINYIMSLNPEPFCFQNADVNGDTNINVLDVIGTINIIMGLQ